MKKLTNLVISLFLLSTISLKADVGIGITGAYHMLDVSGSETTRQSGQVNNGSHEENVVIPEIFVEAIDDNGFAFGVSYIPTREMGSKSRSDTSTTGDGQDTGTYTAKAELDNVLQVYTDIPLGSTATHLKLGIQHATVATKETLNSGSNYPDKDLLGLTVGFGVKGDIPYGANLYYKGELTYTNFETYEATAAGNKVTADLEDIAAKFSVGYKF